VSGRDPWPDPGRCGAGFRPADERDLLGESQSSFWAPVAPWAHGGLWSHLAGAPASRVTKVTSVTSFFR